MKSVEKRPHPQPPKSAGATLKKLALETVQSWAKEYGSAYKKLALGYNYLKQVKRFRCTLEFSEIG